ncbi:MAG: hypothetical protein M5U25_16395 [Planctomycetota bacterium]|nr:hypothetical protein [Planctomycetota bacterium]
MNCDYTEQGLTMDRPILVDGRAGKLLSVSADGLGTTSVTFSDDLPPVDLLARKSAWPRRGLPATACCSAT